MNILIYQDERTGNYTIEVDGAIEFEQLTKDEAREAINEIMEAIAE